jgi:hypothetical protein
MVHCMSLNSLGVKVAGLQPMKDDHSFHKEGIVNDPLCPLDFRNLRHTSP